MAASAKEAPTSLMLALNFCISADCEKIALSEAAMPSAAKRVLDAQGHVPAEVDTFFSSLAAAPWTF